MPTPAEIGQCCDTLAGMIRRGGLAGIRVADASEIAHAIMLMRQAEAIVLAAHDWARYKRVIDDAGATYTTEQMGSLRVAEVMLLAALASSSPTTGVVKG